MPMKRVATNDELAQMTTDNMALASYETPGGSKMPRYYDAMREDQDATDTANDAHNAEMENALLFNRTQTTSIPRSTSNGWRPRTPSTARARLAIDNGGTEVLPGPLCRGAVPRPPDQMITIGPVEGDAPRRSYRRALLSERCSTHIGDNAHRVEKPRFLITIIQMVRKD